MEHSAVRRLAVVGSRDITDLDLVDRFVDRFPNITTIISGGARGVDTSARLIVEESDGMLAFLTRDSRGTKNAIRQAERYRRVALAFNPNDERFYHVNFSTPVATRPPGSAERPPE